MGYEPLILLGLLIVAAAGMFAIVLPLIAIQRTQRLSELLRRVTALEREIRKLRVVGGAIATSVGENPAQPASTAIPVATATKEIPEVFPARAKREPAPSFNLEAWIGGRALGWIAVVLL